MRLTVRGGTPLCGLCLHHGGGALAFAPCLLDNLGCLARRGISRVVGVRLRGGADLFGLTPTLRQNLCDFVVGTGPQLLGRDVCACDGVLSMSGGPLNYV